MPIQIFDTFDGEINVTRRPMCLATIQNWGEITYGVWMLMMMVAVNGASADEHDQDDIFIRKP